MDADHASHHEPLLGADADADTDTDADRRSSGSPSPSPSPPSAAAARPSSWRQQNDWIALAIVSGGCAAANGVFAKLTTTELTTRLAQGVAHVFGLASAEKAVEAVVRASFFGLNLLFNALMWTFFTKALARGHSATQVSVMNTSTNFVLTALLGLVIFSEALPPLWWLGAALLVAGNVIIGRKEESTDDNHSTAGLPAEEEAGSVALEPTSPTGVRRSADMDIAGTSDSRRRSRTPDKPRGSTAAQDEDMIHWNVESP